MEQQRAPHVGKGTVQLNAVKYAANEVDHACNAKDGQTLKCHWSKSHAACTDAVHCTPMEGMHAQMTLQ